MVRYEARVGWYGFTPEGQLEFMTDLRPEFAQRIIAHIENEAHPNALGRFPSTVFVTGMVDVVQYGGARASQPLGIIEHVRTILVVGHEHVPGRVKKTFAGAAVTQAVVSGVFRKDRRIGEVLKEFVGNGTREIRSVTLRVSSRALPKPRIPVRRLIDSRVESSAEKGHRVNGILSEQ